MSNVDKNQLSSLTDYVNLQKCVLISPNNTYLLDTLEESKLFDKSVSILSSKNSIEFFKNLQHTIGDVSNGVIPQNCRLIHNLDSHCKVFVLEEKPQVRSILVDKDIIRILHDYREAGVLQSRFNIPENQIHTLKPPFRFRLSFPYVVYFITVECRAQRYYVRSTSIFYRLHSLKTLNDYLLLSNLPNIGENGVLCGGSGSVNHDGYTTENELCDEVITSFWNAPFNNDLPMNMDMYNEKESRIANFLEWQYNTIKDPFFINDINWVKYKHNVETYLNDIKRNTLLYPVPDMHRIINTFTYMSHTAENRPTNELFDVVVDGYFLSIGDKLNINDDIYTVDTLTLTYHNVFAINNTVNIKASNSKNDSIIIMLDNEENINMVKAAIDELKSIFYLDEFKIGDDNYHIGDIVKYKHLYYKILKIRQQKHNNIEFILGNNYTRKINLLLNTYTKANLIKYDFKTKFERFKPDNLYSEYSGGYRGENIFKHDNQLLKFKRFDIGTNNEIELVFEIGEIIDGKFCNPIKQNYGETQITTIYEYSEKHVETITPELFCIGSMLYFNTDEAFTIYPISHTVATKGDANKTNRVLKNFRIPNLFLEYFLKDTSYNFKECLPVKLKELTYYSLLVEKYISFHVGDKVVVADWDNQRNMLKIQEITDIIVDYRFVNNATPTATDETYLSLIFILKDENNERSEFIYIESLGMTIYDGCVRRAIKKYQGLEVGDKVKINKSYNPVFKKSDVFQIAAFVENINHNTPDVLLTNYTLVSYEEFIRSYTVIKKNNKRYDSMVVSDVDMNKMRLQSGDMFELLIRSSFNQEYQLFDYSIYDSCKEVSLRQKLREDYYMHPRCHYVNNIKRYRRMGFLSERYSTRELRNVDLNKLVIRFGINNYWNGVCGHPLSKQIGTLIERKRG